MGQARVSRLLRYYAQGAKQGFLVPVLGPDGKPLVRRDAMGNAILTHGQFEYVTRACNFQNLVDDPSRGSICVYDLKMIEVDGKEAPEDPQVFEALERLVNDPMLRVFREDDWKARINPEAAAVEKELREREKALSVVTGALEDEKKRGHSLQDQVAELTRALEEVTKPRETKSRERA